MAVTEVSLRIPAEGSIDQRGQRSYTAEYKVVTDDADDGADVILSASGLPGPGDSYGSGANIAFFVSSSARRETKLATGGAVWHVTVSYGPYDWATATPVGPPTDWPIKFRFEPEEFERPCIVDVDGNAILNSAGQPFAEPIMREDSRRVWVVTRNEALSGFDPVAAELFANKLNLYTWNGAAPKTVKAKPYVTGDIQYSQELGGFWFPVTYRFHYNPDGWAEAPLDRGFSELDTSTSPPKLKNIKDKEGQDVKEPALLDGSGSRLADPSPGNEVFLEYHIYEAVDFAPMNLDLSQILGV